MRLDHVGLHERLRTVYGAVDVRLRREVHDGRGTVLGEQAVHQLPVPDPPPHEDVVRILRDRREGLGIARVGKGVQVDHPELAGGHRIEDEVAPDKAGAAGDEDGRFLLPLQSAPSVQRLQVSGYRLQEKPVAEPDA